MRWLVSLLSWCRDCQGTGSSQWTVFWSELDLSPRQTPSAGSGVMIAASGTRTVLSTRVLLRWVVGYIWLNPVQPELFFLYMIVKFFIGQVHSFKFLIGVCQIPILQYWQGLSVCIFLLAQSKNVVKYYLLTKYFMKGNKRNMYLRLLIIVELKIISTIKKSHAISYKL